MHPDQVFGLPIVLSLPIGWSMARTLDPPDGRAGRGDALPMALCDIGEIYLVGSLHER